MGKPKARIGRARARQVRELAEAGFGTAAIAEKLGIPPRDVDYAMGIPQMRRNRANAILRDFHAGIDWAEICDIHGLDAHQLKEAICRHFAYEEIARKSFYHWFNSLRFETDEPLVYWPPLGVNPYEAWWLDKPTVIIHEGRH
jgi:hypothetical protein